jgi:hypothetical protein
MYLFLITLLVLLTGCEQIAIHTTPQKKPKISQSQLAIQAQKLFWTILHQGRYGDISTADSLLTAAYLENPNDPTLAAHIGFLHIWKITEHQRAKKADPLIVNEIILANNYFKEALQLDPDNPIYQGFYGDAQLIQGQIFKDERQQVKAYFSLKEAITHWPQFNYFTAGYPMSTLPASSEHFKKALEWQWLTLDLCAGKKIDRINPDYKEVMKNSDKQGKNRACWNSWIAPYNFEGFFMNMGDMLVKSGDWKTGILIYQNAKLAENYPSWPYRTQLEGKIKNAQAHMNDFQKKSPNRSIMFNSGYGCMACHQKKTL